MVLLMTKNKIIIKISQQTNKHKKIAFLSHFSLKTFEVDNLEYTLPLDNLYRTVSKIFKSTRVERLIFKQICIGSFKFEENRAYLEQFEFVRFYFIGV